ncbi:MAG TPA: PQQ-binding-like beta-propeller repeat protein [Devosia sp.]|nr:PQQ-binding-like beta-propeller repeat protein [Devosia sp.]
MHRIGSVLATSALVMTLLGSSAWAQQQQAADIKAAVDTALAKLTPVTDDVLKNPPDGDWLMGRRTYNGWGYSPLDQINSDNVKNLQLVWSWGLSPGGTDQETPLAHDGVIFVQNSSHLIQALNGATGQLLWQYQYSLPTGVSPSSERAKVLYGDNVIFATRDDHLVAVNTKTGKLAWDQQVADYKKGFAFSGGPMIAKGVVIQGQTNCDRTPASGCFIGGYDANTGKELWRVYTIARGDTPEGNSWNGLPQDSRFGASAWISGSYDPDQDLVFAGVGQPYPWPAVLNGLLPKNPDPKYTNNALYTDSTLAIVPETGKLKWYHQYLATDTLDLDYVYERLLVDLPFKGQDTKQVVTAGKLAIIESLDRTTGKWLWAHQTVPQNVVSKIDPVTGEKTINPDVIPQVGKTTFNCPADPGGRAWQATSYSPKTKMMYMPTVEFCSNTVVNPLDPGQVYTGGGLATYNRVPRPDSDGNIGQVRAVSLTDQKDVWMYRQHAPVTSSTLPTAGNIVFEGTLDRKLIAFDATTGKVLWTSPTLDNSIESFPITYSANGKQYVAVVTNWSSGLGRLKLITPEIQLPQDNPHTLYVFALPDNLQTAQK